MAHRIEEMADRSEEEAKSAAGKEPFERLIPLEEVIAMANGFAVKGKRTEREYMRLLVQLDPEFEVLRKIPVEQNQPDGRGTDGMSGSTNFGKGR